MLYYILFNLFAFVVPQKVDKSYIEQRNLKNFQTIEVHSVVQLFFSEGENYAIKVETDSEEKAALILTEVHNNKLIVSIQSRKKGIEFKKVNVYVTAPKVLKFRANSAAKLIFQTPIQQDHLSIYLNSASNVKGSLHCKHLKLQASSASNASLEVQTITSEINLSGASNATLKGKVGNNTIESSGASDFNGQAYLSKSTQVNCSGASSIEVYCTDSLEASATGASSIRYWGNPQYKTILNLGASSITKK
jgi:hypothetical protein